MATTMKAVRFHPPGGPDQLKYGTEDGPSQPEKGEVLIKVHGVGLIWTELYWPVYQNAQKEYITHIPGHDFSGVVTAVGPGSEDSTLRVGDEVYAFTNKRNHQGAMAEYAVADVDQVVLKPSKLSLIEAAAVPLSALTAWQALFDHGKLKKGQKLLVTGGAGGTGVWAVQFAHMIGAHVIATGSSPRSREILEGLGVDEFIDYKEAELESLVKEVDLVLECVGEKVLKQCFKCVKKDGLIISITTYDCKQKAMQNGVNGMFFIVQMDADQLNNITKLLEDGTVRPILDHVVPLERAREAFEDASRGQVHGKIVISVP